MERSFPDKLKWGKVKVRTRTDCKKQLKDNFGQDVENIDKYEIFCAGNDRGNEIEWAWLKYTKILLFF